MAVEFFFRQGITIQQTFHGKMSQEIGINSIEETNFELDFKMEIEKI